MVLQPEKIPVEAACNRLAKQLDKDGLQWAMTGGEDYQLVGTMAAVEAEKICEQYAQQPRQTAFYYRCCRMRQRCLVRAARNAAKNEKKRI